MKHEVIGAAVPPAIHAILHAWLVSLMGRPDFVKSELVFVASFSANAIDGLVDLGKVGKLRLREARESSERFARSIGLPTEATLKAEAETHLLGLCEEIRHAAPAARAVRLELPWL